MATTRDLTDSNWKRSTKGRSNRMSSGKVTEKPNATITAWDFVKDNYGSDDRLAVVIKNLHENRVTQRLDTAKAIASPGFQMWLRDHNERGGEIYLTTNALMAES